MEMKEIYDCQEILNFVTKARTEEELKCDKLFNNPHTIEWLSERKNNLDKEIKEIEEKISGNIGINKDIEQKKKEQEEINVKIRELESNKQNIANNLDKIPHEIIYKVDCSGVDFSKVTTPPTCGTIEIPVHTDLKNKIIQAENKIKEYESDIYDKGQSKHKVDEIIKNKEAEGRNCEAHVSSAKRELNSAENDFASATKRGEYYDIGLWDIKRPLPETWGECWNLNSPELSSSCVQRYRKKVEEKKSSKETFEIILKWNIRDLKEEKDKSKKLSETITSLNTKKNEEIAKKDQYIKEKQEVEAKIQGVLDQKKSLETDIGKQHAEQMKINDELLSLERNAKNLDSSLYEGQKKELSQELSDTKMTIHQINEYQNTEMIQEEAQHQEL
jgi:chromosome segregation ATPase